MAYSMIGDAAALEVAKAARTKAQTIATAKAAAKIEIEEKARAKLQAGGPPGTAPAGSEASSKTPIIVGGLAVAAVAAFVFLRR
jgi:hypothetical protein